MTSVHRPSVSSLSPWLLTLALLAGDACAQNTPPQAQRPSLQQTGQDKHRQVTRGPVAPDQISYPTQSPGEQRPNR